MRRHRTLIVAVVAALLAGSALTAVANHLTTTPTFTGCLNKTSGAIGKVKQGPEPLSPCLSGETQLHLSGGDITGVFTGTNSGLIGGAASGRVDLKLNYPLLDARYVNEGQTDSVTSAMIADGSIDNVDLVPWLMQQIKCGANAGERVNLSSCALLGVNFSDTFMYGANLNAADLSYANLSGAYLESAILSGADLYHADLSGAYVGYANLTGAKFSGANLTSVNLESSNLAGATDLIYANRTNVTWFYTTCPDGTNSHTNGTSPESCEGHLTP